MAKFHIKLKLTGLELEIEGTRDDAPLIQQALTQQFAGLLQPATVIVEGEIPAPAPTNGNGVVVQPPLEKTKRRRQVRTGSTPAAASSNGESAVDWRHDPETYGSPLQTWNSSQKAVWLLHVVASAANLSELSAPRIALTFNKHFRQAGPIRANNLARDLGKLKSIVNGQPPQVGQDTTKNPSTWYLVDAGSRVAQQLVAAARGQQA
jgi:hypothetical protein